MRRRTILAAAVAAAVASEVRAQPSAMPRIAFLSGRSLSTDAHLLQAVRDGLKTIGYVDGQNVTMDIRWADGHYDRAATLAAELAATRPDVLVAVGGNPVSLAARAATATIPIVFGCGADPVVLGLVSNLSRPDGNLTGMTLWTQELEPKRLELLHELLPGARSVAMMVNPTDPGTAAALGRAQEAAAMLGLKLEILNVAQASEIEPAFERLPAGRIDALAVAADAFLIGQRAKIIALAAARRLPAIFPARDFADDGGLASFGARWVDGYHLVGVYAGRILKGARPADLPVQRPTTYELVLNLKTARTLGLALPTGFLARVDEAIE